MNGYKIIMNVFYLNEDPKQCAEEHCDKHVVKMVIEYAQLLSTAHRVLDGHEFVGKTKTGRKAKRYRLEDKELDQTLYLASHLKHPDEIWIQKSSKHYQYVYDLFGNLCDEFTNRYGKKHLTDLKLRKTLATLPRNIPQGDFEQPPQCMPEYCKTEDSIVAYKNYYIHEKKSFAAWKTKTPEWYK